MSEIINGTCSLFAIFASSLSLSIVAPVGFRLLMLSSLKKKDEGIINEGINF
jgi:hypothetical protein